MAIAKNVGRGEGVLRIIFGVIFILLGFFLAGFWRPLSIVVGAILVLTTIVGH
jgi:hypothetical protein